MVNILLCSVPLMDVEMPAPAPFHLKGQLTDSNVIAEAVDTNVIFFNRVKDQWNDVIAALLSSPDYTVEADEPIFVLIKSELEKVFHEQIKLHNPTWIGLSVFTKVSRWCTQIVCEYIKKHFPDVKILLGGAGLGLTLGDYTDTFASDLKQRNLCDEYILGEGEISLQKFFQHVKYPGIASQPVQITDLNDVKWSDYSSVNWNLYPLKSNVGQGSTLGSIENKHYVLTGSRGCVRKCDFCDVYKMWPKYRSRRGEDIAEEMTHHYNQSKVRHFYFSDSLINGSMRDFRSLSKTLLDSKENGTLAEDIYWGGQFIARTNEQMNLEDLKQAKRSGFVHCSIGLEHASERIRDFMNKKTPDAAVWDTVENLAKANIVTAYNFIIGHPRETIEDLECIVKWLHDFKWASDAGHIEKINLQTGIYFLEGTDFYTKRDNLVDFQYGGTEFWVSKYVPDLNFAEIYRRRMYISEVAESLGYRLHDEDSLKNYMNRKLKRFKEHEEKNS
jgi:radical SAM superfamily enzyme YgiQ (UPF0313 family)